MSEVRIVNLNSHTLKKPMAFSIYLPDTYPHKGLLPVLYFFHGRNGDEHFIEQLNVRDIADKLIKEGVINPMIIVCPSMDNTRGLNTSDCSAKIFNDEMSIDVGRYEDYFIQEIVPFVDDNFNTITSRDRRYVGGASAGGFAAIHYGLRYPELFSKVGGHMPAVELDLDPSDLPYYGSEEKFHNNNPLEFGDFNEYHKIQSWYLDAGDKDEGGFDKTIKILNELLVNQGIKTECHISNGHHNLEYISENLEKYLIFYNGKLVVVR